MRTFYTYIMTNRNNRVLYTGITNNMWVRGNQHKNKTCKGFTSRYNVNKLVWFQEFETAPEAIAREKEIKGWRREKKIALIESINPHWKDLLPRFHPLKKTLR